MSSTSASPGDGSGSVRPTRLRLAIDSPGYVEPALAGWAHLVIEPAESDSDSNAVALGKVFLGPQQSAKENTLPAFRAASPPVAAVVNCTNNFPDHHADDGVSYCRIAINDEAGANILVYLDGATRFVRHHVLRGNSVLVHCQMGVSRSATVVIAYLMKYQSMSIDEAYSHVKMRRPMIKPNPGFRMQLDMYNERLAREQERTASAVGGTVSEKRGGVVFSGDWAESSLAMFRTIGHVVEDPTEFFVEIDAATDVDRAVFVAVDYVFGRGVLDADLPWLAGLCDAFRACRRDPLPAVEGLFSGGSEFGEMWSGEVHPERIRGVVEAASTSQE